MKDSGILMLGTSLQTMGGIASVMAVYRDAGLFERWPIEHIVTHADGSARAKAAVAAKACWQVASRLLLSRPRLMHLHVSSRASFWRKSVFMGMARLAGVPYLLHLHGSEFRVFYEKECGRVGRSIVRHFFRRAERVLVLSQSWSDWVASICPEAVVTKMYNPVVLPGSGAAEEQRERQTVLFLGRLGQRKGSFDLVRAVASIAADHPGLQIVMGGDGDVAQVRRLAGELGVASNVITPGWIGPEEKAAWLSRAGIYVLPSYHEGLPMSLLEAMAAGMPVITTPVGGIPEAVTHGVEGLVVNPGDVEALAVALRTLLADNEMRCRMGRQARLRVAREFATSALLPALEQIYRAYAPGGRHGSWHARTRADTE